MSEDAWKAAAVALAETLERQVPVANVDALLAPQPGKDWETVTHDLARLIKTVGIGDVATSDLQGQLTWPELDFAAKQAVRSAIQAIAEAPGD